VGAPLESRPARRAAGRGALFVGVGIIAVAVGVGLVPHLIDDTLSFRAAVSAVLLVGGATAVIVGARSLLRSRARWRQVVGGAAIVVAMALAAWVIAPPVAATNVAPSAVTVTPADLGLEFESVEIVTADDVRLAAWVLPGTNGAAVVVLHGAGSTRSDALDHAAVLQRDGFTVLLLDARGHGDSGGTAMDFGWYGDLDVAAAVDYLLTADAVDPARIGVLGLSMGGEEAIGAAAAHGTVRAVVAEGATARTAADKTWLSDAYGWRGWVQEQIERVQFGLTDLLTDASPPATLAASIAQADASFLLITAGRVADEGHAADHLAAAAPDRVTVWTVDDADHTGGLAVAPTEWERRVVEFFDDHLAPAS
jgi:pimeloyl-ACP methyl ester carboxylesterase